MFSPKSKIDRVPIEGEAKKQLDPIIDVPFSPHGHDHNGVHTGHSLDKGGFCILFCMRIKNQTRNDKRPQRPRNSFPSQQRLRTMPFLFRSLRLLPSSFLQHTQFRNLFVSRLELEQPCTISQRREADTWHKLTDWPPG